MSGDKSFFTAVSDNIKKLLGKGVESGGTSATEKDVEAYDPPANEEKEMRRVFETAWDTDGDKEYDVEYSFMISSDFVQMKSHAAEADLVLVYSPDDPEPEGINAPYIFVSTGDGRVFELGEQFRETGKTEGFIQKLSGGKFRFKCLAEYYGDVIYLYGGDIGKTWENCGIAMVYPKSLKGTPTEKILMSALDHAAETYEEKFTEIQSG
ncbi:MAG: hypothetical protein K2N72_14425 [Oscillospiraceae bacterium]|nr:hypothetical protein [Oscillospiraceae bacterium]